MQNLNRRVEYKDITHKHKVKSNLNKKTVLIKNK